MADKASCIHEDPSHCDDMRPRWSSGEDHPFDGSEIRKVLWRIWYARRGRRRGWSSRYWPRGWCGLADRI